MTHHWFLEESPLKKFSNLYCSLAWSVFFAISMSSCTSGGGDSSSQSNITNFPYSLPNGTTLPVQSGVNVMKLTVNGTGCSDTYPNKPCASVTVCEPGTSNCITVNDLLVDTGSYGLRIFKSALGSLSLPQVTNASSNPVAQCVHFGDGSADWGPVANADVTLGNEPAITTPIQVIDSTYFSGHYSCSSPDTGPSEAGFNGILGIGLFAQDCGATCVTAANNNMYYACTGTTCTGTRIALASQVQNPVSLLPTDNNGVILELPSIAATGTDSTDGYIVFGIGTRANNVPGGVSSFAADPSTGQFVTSFNGHTYRSFIDSGSNGLFFPSGVLTDCGGSLSGWFCPTDQTILSATNSAYSGSPSGSLNFQVVSMSTLLANKSAWVFPSMAGSSGSGGMNGLFDWGLPFYLGRNVYLGIENTNSTLGTGPYWAY